MPNVVMNKYVDNLIKMLKIQTTATIISIFCINSIREINLTISKYGYHNREAKVGPSTIIVSIVMIMMKIEISPTARMEDETPFLGSLLNLISIIIMEASPKKESEVKLLLNVVFQPESTKMGNIPFKSTLEKLSNSVMMVTTIITGPKISLHLPMASIFPL